MRYRFIYILFIFNFFFSFSQKKNFYISGQAKIIIGNDTLPCNELSLKLKNKHTYAYTDSLGYFEFKNLKKGKYVLEMIYNTASKNKFEVNIVDKSIKNFDIVFNSNCEFTSITAEKDIQENNIRLLITGGIAPIYHRDQHLAEKKYSFKYYDFGCVIEDFKCIDQYNKTIFEYFDKKYSEKWRKEVRDDIYGLKN
ncbi:FEKKY domain-containing protein [Tenacibaculum jejuense]|uniref:Uncharacterized protein n=1 Tax=Tenacibaculum jejuense TaxID=584609 RepID=A0A238U4P8_9FLAO|nr:hypothetical protein [Tenacibaculum jejuense]SNR14015.1 protein of unknown function [Tenacibaculum jejuense]